MDEKMWFNWDRPWEMLHATNVILSDRKRRLFAVACCRRYWDLFTDDQFRHPVEIAEKYADGNASDEDLRAIVPPTGIAYDEGRRHLFAAFGTTGDPTRDSVGQVCYQVIEEAQVATAKKAMASGLTRMSANFARDERVAQCCLFRDIVGNPFRTVSVHPDWLAWNDGTVPKLAQTIYHDHRFDLLPILADALEESGCDNADILGHCRGPGPHVRGCWLVDLMLGKT